MPAEDQELQRVVQATSERVDTVRRATALLSVAAGKSRTVAGLEAHVSRQAVTQLVKCFNQRGLAALSIATGRGRKPIYTSQQQARIVAEVQRVPDRQEDQTATWSLMTLRQALRKEALPHTEKRNDPPGVTCAWLQLPAYAHLVPHRLRSAGAQERHGDRV